MNNEEIFESLYSVLKDIVEEIKNYNLNDDGTPRVINKPAVDSLNSVCDKLMVIANKLAEELDEKSGGITYE